MGGAPLTPGAPRPAQSRWIFWVLGGCLLFVILIVSGIAGVYYWTKSRFTAMVEEQTDPLQREQNLKKMLGAQTLPPGYHAGVNISLGLARGAWLSDKPMGDDNPRYDQRGFIFNESIRAGETESAVEKFVAGKSGNVVSEMGVRLRSDESLGGGAGGQRPAAPLVRPSRRSRGGGAGRGGPLQRRHHPLLRQPPAVGRLVPARRSGNADAGRPESRQRDRGERHPRLLLPFPHL
ncbi:MAG TPA: hypothetical protein VF266_06850 [Thermoanaerobaculia bacterium]